MVLLALFFQDTDVKSVGSDKYPMLLLGGTIALV
jgi:hypothetical protein